MTFFAFGLNHETAPLQVRQAFALDEGAKRQLYATLQLSSEAELVLVSTCNRTEAYLYGTASDKLAIQSVLGWKAGRAWPEEAAFALEDEAAVRHILHVASGLKSQVLGDAQILAQVKDAYRIAVDADRVGTVMHRLMHTAFRGAKRVAHETALASGAASVSSAAVALARVHFEGQEARGLAGRRALLVGAGQMGCLAFEALRIHDLASIAVANRSEERAREVSETTGASLVPWEARYDALQDADIVVVATGASEPILHAAEMPPRPSGQPPLLLIDIAMPRNVDPAIDALPGYQVFDLDALNDYTEQTNAARRAELPAAEALCEEILVEFVSWVFHHQALQPTIQAIRDTFEEIRRQEIARHHHRFSDADREELERITRSIMQKLLAIPIVRLKSVDPESVDYVRGIELLQTLFSRPGCDDAAAGAEEQEAPQAEASQAEAQEAVRCPFELGGGAVEDPLSVEEPSSAAHQDEAGRG